MSHEMKEVNPETERIARLLAKEMGGLDVMRTYDGHAILATESGKQVAKAEVRNTRRGLSLFTYGEYSYEKKEELAGLMRKNGIEFSDCGMLFHIIKRDSNYPYAGIPFPELKPLWSIEGDMRRICKRLGVKAHYDKDGLYVVELSNEDPKDVGERRTSFTVGYEKTSLASVIACTEKKWVDSVQVGSTYYNLMVALVQHDTEFPFNGFVRRQLERENVDFSSEETKNMLINYREEAARLKAVSESYTGGSRKGWDTTDPSRHDPGRFRYIVHSLLWGGEMQPDNLDKKEFGEYFTDPFEHPEDMLRRGYISCSVIDERHCNTFGDSSFILKVPECNIRRAECGDLHTSPKEKGAKDYDAKVRPAYEILKGTSQNEWNEVVISGTNENNRSRAEIVGCIILVDPLTKEPLSKEGAKKFIEFCEKWNLPLIRQNAPFTKKFPVPGED